MTKPRPKFCISEEVMDLYAHPAIPCEVLEMHWATENEKKWDENDRPCVAHEGWHYRLSSDGLFTHEKWVGKLPPEQRIQFTDGIWQPKREEVKALLSALEDEK